MVVLDTCAIIEACKTSPSFSAKTLKQITSGAYILSISFAEIACKIKLGKLELGMSPRELFLEFSQIAHMEIVDVSTEIWLDSIELSWNDNKDPADRAITAFATKKHLPIVTNDQKIKQFYKKVIW